MVGPSHHNTLSAGGSFVGVLRLLDLGNERLKSLADMLVVAGASFGPAAVKPFCKLPGILLGNLTLFGAQVALIADNDNRDPIGTLRELASL